MIHKSHVMALGDSRFCERCGGDLFDGLIALSICPQAEANADGITWRTRGAEDTTRAYVVIDLPEWPIEGPAD